MWREIILGTLLFSLCCCEKADQRIVGGQNVALGQLPYMASIRSWGSTVHFAGGVIISNRWILSSAHFLSGFSDNALNIVMGIIDLSSQGTSRRSELIVLHPDFNPSGRVNDIACVRMVTPALTFSPTLNTIHMDSNPVMDLEMGFTAGWGSTNANMGPNSQMLQRLQIVIQNCANPVPFESQNVPTIPTVLPPEETTTDLPGVPTAPTPGPVPQSSALCTQSLGIGGICTTDIGGPLITFAGLVGIASWHPNPCGSQPDVFTPIRVHRIWIALTTGV